MIQYECNNVPQVAQKIAELTNTKCDRLTWKEYCENIKKDGGSDTIDYIAFDENDIEKDVSVFVGYDKINRCWLVGVNNID